MMVMMLVLILELHLLVCSNNDHISHIASGKVHVLYHVVSICVLLLPLVTPTRMVSNDGDGACLNTGVTPENDDHIATVPGD